MHRYGLALGTMLQMLLIKARVNEAKEDGNSHQVDGKGDAGEYGGQVAVAGHSLCVLHGIIHFQLHVLKCCDHLILHFVVLPAV